MWSTDLSSSIDGLNQQWKGWSIIDMRKSKIKWYVICFHRPVLNKRRHRDTLQPHQAQAGEGSNAFDSYLIQNTQYTILSIVFITRHSSCKYCKIVFYPIYLGGAGIHATRQRRTIPTILSSAHSVTEVCKFLRRYFTFFVGQYFKRVADHFMATWFLFWPKALRDLHPIFLFWHSLSLLNNPFLLQKIVSIASMLQSFLAALENINGGRSRTV